MDQKALLNDCVAYITSGIRKVIETFGPRAPGSEAERQAQAHIAEELKPWADEVRSEEFTVHTHAFMGFMPVTGVLFLAATVLLTARPWPALALSLAALVVTMLEFLFYRRFLDPLFPGYTSVNVDAIRRASGTPKRRIILSGHADAAFEWPFHYYGGPILLKLVLGGALLAAIYILILNVATVITGGACSTSACVVLRTLSAGRFFCIPFFAALCLFSNFRRTVPGANDNLTGSFAAMAALRYLDEAGTRFGNTEVRCVVMGSEEAGLRGAKAYAERHAAELRDMETVFIALETLRDLGHLAVYSRDMSGVVKHDPRACALLKEAGRRCAFDLKYETIYAGASDAAAISESGVPAAALAAMDPAPARYYHTRLDNWDNLSPECLEASLRITMEAVALFDQNGLSGDYAS